MAGLCEGGNEPGDTLKAIVKVPYKVRNVYKKSRTSTRDDFGIITADGTEKAPPKELKKILRKMNMQISIIVFGVMYAVLSQGKDTQEHNIASCVTTIILSKFQSEEYMLFAFSDPETSVSKPFTTEYFNETSNINAANIIMATIHEASKWSVNTFVLGTQYPETPKLTWKFQNHVLILWPDEEYTNLDNLISLLEDLKVYMLLNPRGRFLVLLPPCSESDAKEDTLLLFQEMFTSYYIIDVLFLVPHLSKQTDNTENVQGVVLDVYTIYPLHTSKTVFHVDDLILIDKCPFGKASKNYSSLFPTKIPKTFHGREIRVSVVINEPTSGYAGSYKDGNNETTHVFTGHEVEILHQFAQILNLTVRFLPPRSAELPFISKLREGVRDVLYNKADLGIGSMKMADETEQRLESALKSIEDIADAGGYRKKKTKEELQKAVSTIRKCFKTLKDALEDKKNRKENHRNEVRNGGTENAQGGNDSYIEG
ncbi:hypothetical protein ANN_03384 [Periplaneta americana]|uniref:Uncharacterized protein n=1 Tax=Periplaneta americana TaxID=6978 RepID=A0ABQ8U1S0_PERAM|nr:hypothetical protein ANN_03384 [Periplaneta americana]